MQSALAPKLRSVIVDHLAEASPAELARVVGAIAGNGSAPLEVVGTLASIQGPRFVKLGADGREILDPQDGEHVAVYDRTTGLTWSRGNIGKKRLEHAEAEKACAALKLAGHSDWRLPTIQELLAIVDYSRHEPAIDVSVFDCESYAYWTSTPAAWNPAGAAWCVLFYYGGAGGGGRDFVYYVRAVRSGQAL